MNSTEVMKLLIINGPNLNLILERDKSYYGDKDIESIKNELIHFFPEVGITFLTSNSEYEIIERIQKANRQYDGLIINPGALSHTSIGIRDALELCKIPKIEVHLSNLATRDEFRKVSLTASKCDGYISGFKNQSYLGAVFLICELIKNLK